MAASAARSRRLTAALCLALAAAFGWGLQRWTHGFEVWTFEGRRLRQIETGALTAAPVALRDADDAEPRLWRPDAAAPAAYLVDFIYTRCPGVCRALGSEYQQMQHRLPAGVRLVSISFDVAHDDPAALRHAAAAVHADPARWTFAVPATADDASALLGSLGVVVVPDGAGGFVHNGSIHLLDARGRLRGLYELDEWPQALAAARRLAGGAAS
ncbi:MAG TPA: SCO family protein [Ideonella sp.]|nr:SCO family protein [Ideonella sp.]